MKKCENKCEVCNIHQLTYQKSVLNKQASIDALYSKYSKQIMPIIAASNPYNYRCKVIASFKSDRKNKVISGIYQENSHNLISISDCTIQNETANAIIADITRLAIKFRIPIYNEDKRMGLLRHVLVRVGYYSNEVLLCLVLGSDKFPSRRNFIKAIMQLHPEITTITSVVNNRKTSVVIENEAKTLYGPGFIYDYIGDFKFKISTNSFYQINPVQTKLLYDKAIELAEFTGNEVLVDAYSGIGTIGMIASKHVKKVISVELNKAAFLNAKSNIALNKLTNVSLINMDATKYLQKLSQQKAKIDVLILDPTRAGTTKEFLNAVDNLKIKKIIYVSCNPITQVRDIKNIVNNYKIKYIQAVDLFPFTNHVETVVLMSRIEK